MKRVLVFVVALVGFAAAPAADPPKVSTKFDDLKAILTALGTAEKADVVLHEGLPHPFNEKKTFQAEKKKETIESGGELFYKEPLTLKPDDTTTVLARLLDATSYAEFRGEKKCGGFHPDQHGRQERVPLPDLFRVSRGESVRPEGPGGPGRPDKGVRRAGEGAQGVPKEPAGVKGVKQQTPSPRPLPGTGVGKRPLSSPPQEYG
jgi:hypothetical protein